MIKVTWEHDPDDWMDQLTRAAFDATIERVKGALEGVRCPVHGEHPTLVVTGSSTDTLDMTVRGCCERLNEPARAKLGLLGGQS